MVGWVYNGAMGREESQKTHQFNSMAVLPVKQVNKNYSNQNSDFYLLMLQNFIQFPCNFFVHSSTFKMATPIIISCSHQNFSLGHPSWNFDEKLLRIIVSELWHTISLKIITNKTRFEIVKSLCHQSIPLLTDASSLSLHFYSINSYIYWTKNYGHRRSSKRSHYGHSYRHSSI